MHYFQRKKKEDDDPEVILGESLTYTNLMARLIATRIAVINAERKHGLPVEEHRTILKKYRENLQRYFALMAKK